MTGGALEEWSEVGIMDLLTVASGQVDPRLPEYRDLPLIAPDHIESGTGRLLGVSTAAEQGAISGKYLVEPGDVIYSKIRPYLRKAHLATFRALCSADMYPLRPKPDVDPFFLLNMLLSESFTKFAVSASMRSGIPKINRVELAEFRRAVPPVAIQRRIGEALEAADDLIISLELLIAKKRDINQGTMQQLLTGRTRLLGHSQPWITTTVGQVANVKTGPFGSSLHESDYVAQGTPIITVEHLGERAINGRGAPMVSDGDRRRLEAYSLVAGDVVFSRVGSIDRNALVSSKEAGWLFSGRLLRVRFDPSLCDPMFMSAQFHSRRFVEAVRSVAVGQTMPSLNTAILSGIKIDLPPVDEQRAISRCVVDLNRELDHLDLKLQKARDVKTGMMQGLLTGRTRLAVKEAVS